MSRTYCATCDCDIASGHTECWSCSIRKARVMATIEIDVIAPGGIVLGQLSDLSVTLIIDRNLDLEEVEAAGVTAEFTTATLYVGRQSRGLEALIWTAAKAKYLRFPSLRHEAEMQFSPPRDTNEYTDGRSALAGKI
jgi:hypothetical protein